MQRLGAMERLQTERPDRKLNFELVPLPDVEDEDFDKREDRLSSSARRRVKISVKRRQRLRTIKLTNRVSSRCWP